MPYVLDTNIISAILHQNAQVLMRMRQVTAAGNAILGCPLVWYEVRRGLIARDSKRQMPYFEALFAKFKWQNYTRADWELAASWWAQRKAQGRPIGDADLLIAVFARNHGAVLVTDNAKDFDGLDVSLENWLKD